MQTIRRTRNPDRRVTLLLLADHEDRGPYYLVDLAGFGVSWRKPAIELVPGERSDHLHRGTPYARRTTWIPIFERARLAFTLVEEDPTVTPREAKEIADKVLAKTDDGRWRPTQGEIERYAFALLAKRRGASRDRTRRRKRARNARRR